MSVCHLVSIVISKALISDELRSPITLQFLLLLPEKELVLAELVELATQSIAAWVASKKPSLSLTHR